MVELDAMFVCDPSSASAYLTHASAYWDIPCRAFGKVLSCECKLQCMHYVYEGANMCLPPPRLLGVCWSHVRKAVCRDTVSTNVCRGRAVPTYKRWPLLVESGRRTGRVETALASGASDEAESVRVA